MGKLQEKSANRPIAIYDAALYTASGVWTSAGRKPRRHGGHASKGDGGDAPSALKFSAHERGLIVFDHFDGKQVGRITTDKSIVERTTLKSEDIPSRAGSSSFKIEISYYSGNVTSSTQAALA